MRKIIYRPLLLLVFTVWHEAVDASITHECIHEDSRLSYRFVPECSGIELDPEQKAERPYKLNKAGLRDRDYAPHPDKGVFRILAVGGSMTTNYRDGVGWAPTLEAVFNRRLRTMAAKGEYSGPFKKVEVIAASELGYNMIQSYLRYDELYPYYHPNMVLLLDSLPMILEEHLFHHRAQQKDHSGLATAFGTVSKFWPLPKSTERWLWRLSWADRLRAISDATQMTMIKYRMLVSPSSVCPADENCFLYWHKKYLMAFRKKVEADGAQFLAACGDPVNKVYSKKVIWYLGGTIANKLAPWPPYSKAESEAFYRQMEQEKFPIYNVTETVSEAYRRQHLAAGGSLKEAELAHLDEKHALWSHEKVAEEIFPLITKALSRDSRPSRREK